VEGTRPCLFPGKKKENLREKNKRRTEE